MPRVVFGPGGFGIEAACGDGLLKMKSINLNIEKSAHLKADDTTLEMIVKVLEKCNASLGLSQ
jgi:hypothetical protein